MSRRSFPYLVKTIFDHHDDDDGDGKDDDAEMSNCCLGSIQFALDSMWSHLAGGPHVRHRPPEISRDKWGQLSLTQRFSNVTCIFTSVEIRQRLVESCQITNQFRVFGDCSAGGEFYGGSW